MPTRRQAPPVRSMTDTVQRITFSFNFSAQRLPVFQAELGLDEDAQVDMNNITNLQSLCEIRLLSRANDLCAFKSALTAVVTALDYFEEDGDGKARRHLTAFSCHMSTVQTVQPLPKGHPLRSFSCSSRGPTQKYGMHSLTEVYRTGQEYLRLRRAIRVRTCPLIQLTRLARIEGKLSAGRG